THDCCDRMTMRLSFTLLLTLVAASLTAFAVRPWAEDDPGDIAPWGVRAHATVGGSLEIGVTTLELARNSWKAWTADDLESVDRFERDMRAHADVVMWFADWESSEFDAAQARAVVARGSMPAISWEPW